MKLVLVLLSLGLAIACVPSNKNQVISGALSTGIVNGEKVAASDDTAKHTVAITDDKLENCTGTLIAKNLVLTAGHCETLGVMMYVAFGLEVSEHNMTQVVRYPVIDYRKIKGADKVDFENQDTNHMDLMIVRFEGELPAGYAPAELAAPDFEVQSGDNLIIAGYGVTHGYKQTGDGYLRKAQVVVTDAQFSETEVQTDERRRGSCNIDSGGPAFVETDDGKLRLWGVIARGDENCRKWGIYTKISSYRAWVDSIIQDIGE